jgi:hypothetical protein
MVFVGVKTIGDSIAMVRVNDCVCRCLQMVNIIRFLVARVVMMLVIFV